MPDTPAAIRRPGAWPIVCLVTVNSALTATATPPVLKDWDRADLAEEIAGSNKTFQPHAQAADCALRRASSLIRWCSCSMTTRTVSGAHLRYRSALAHEVELYVAMHMVLVGLDSFVKRSVERHAILESLSQVSWPPTWSAPLRALSAAVPPW